ncbi:hypothetical protein ACFQZI_12350 [Mucilaginibacter lutimaris]|uniref:DUF3592 domain-containing protein n=1 Tax=Mucilaginibacter lutimaris TaxID=931629 RepID=A0ABW2ZHM2_9SPHI
MFQNRSQWSARIGLILIAGILYYFFSNRLQARISNDEPTDWLGLVVIVFASGLIIGVVKIYDYHRSYVDRHGIVGTAIVLKIFKTGITKGYGSSWYNQIPQYEMVLDVNVGNSSTYRAYATKYYRLDEPLPEAGTILKVRIDPKDKYKMVID